MSWVVYFVGGYFPWDPIPMAGNQEIGRCPTRGKSEGSVGRRQKVCKWGIHPGFEIQKSKTGVSVAPETGSSPKLFFGKIKLIGLVDVTPFSVLCKLLKQDLWQFNHFCLGYHSTCKQWKVDFVACPSQVIGYFFVLNFFLEIFPRNNYTSFSNGKWTSDRVAGSNSLLGIDFFLKAFQNTFISSGIVWSTDICVVSVFLRVKNLNVLSG